jgi:small-conductance mechanosensitive channel
MGFLLVPPMDLSDAATVPEMLVGSRFDYEPTVLRRLTTIVGVLFVATVLLGAMCLLGLAWTVLRVCFALLSFRLH